MSERRNRAGLTEQEFLAAYDPAKFDRPSVTVDAVVFTVADRAADNYRKTPEKDLRLLLVRRADHPFIGQWALPGGFVAMDEGLDAAAARELREETGVEGIYLEQLYTWGDVGRDPRTRVISTSYLALVDASRLTLQAGDDAADARWFSVKSRLVEEVTRPDAEGRGYTQEQTVEFTLTADGEESCSARVLTTRTVKGTVAHVERRILSSENLAFDHAKVVAYGLERLRTKTEWSDIAFNLMPEKFSLGSLQQVYETILGKELVAPAFRRKIAPMVVETNQMERDGGHRPARLYIFNPRWTENSL